MYFGCLLVTVAVLSLLAHVAGRERWAVNAVRLLLLALLLAIAADALGAERKGGSHHSRPHAPRPHPIHPRPH
jgi:uncharacterized membrane protein